MKETQEAHSSSDEQWLRRVRRGDGEAFEAWCRELQSPLFGYALRMLSNRSEAEEVVQESLVRLYVAIRRKQLKANPRAYLFSIAHNLIMQYWRTIHPQELPENLVQAPGPHPTERNLLREEIEKALAELPEKQRAALLLRDFAELSYQEIAQTLPASLDQVKVWIHRGRKKLSTLLDHEGQYVGKR